MHTAFLSIGSNLGDKKANLNAAIRMLNNEREITVKEISPYYQTEPQNFLDQDWFVNAALKIVTRFSCEDLLDCLKRLESELDKDGKPFRFGPRRIDLDIIYYDDLVYKSSKIEVPHPRMHERCFVLVPLCDIAADTLHPVFKLTPGELLDKIEERQSQGIIALDKEA